MPVGRKPPLDPRLQSGPAAVWLAAAPFLLLFLYCSYQILDADLGHHLTMGEYIVRHRTIPATNIFSYPNESHPLLDYKWLFQAALYLLHEGFGLWGLYAVQAGVPLLTLAVMARGMGFSENPPENAWLVLAAVPVLATRAGPRPDAVSLLLLAVYGAILLSAARDSPPPRSFYALPFLQVLWVNLHVYFIFGPALVGCFALAAMLPRRAAPGAVRPQPAWGRAFALTCLACLVNPCGIRGALYPFQVMWELRGESGLKALSEMQPFDLDFLRQAWRDADSLATLFLLGLPPVLFLWARRLDRHALAVYAAFAPLAAMNLRSRSLAAVLFPMIAARCWKSCLDERREDRTLRFRGRPAYPWVLAAGLWTATLALSWGLVTNRLRFDAEDPRRFGFGISEAEIPLKAADFVQQAGIEGPLFNNFGIGSNLLWRLYPRLRPFIDGEINWYGAGFFRSYQQAMADPAAHFEALDWRYAFSFCVLRPGSLDTRALLSWLARHPRWVPVYLDEAVVFVKDSPENRAVIKRHRLDVPARIAGLIQEYRRQSEERSGLLGRIQEKDGLALSRLGQVALAFGLIGLAESAFLNELAVEPRSSAPYQNLGVVCMLTSQWTRARRYLSEAIARGARNPQLKVLLEDAARKEHPPLGQEPHPSPPGPRQK